MADYCSMYKKLFNAVTDTIHILQTAQVETEQMYISQEEARILLLKPDSEGFEDNGGDNDGEK